MSAGVAAIISIPQFHDTVIHHRVEVALGLILLISVANLRGIKESGRIFAIPTYGYIVAVIALVGIGLTKSYFGWFGGVSQVPFDPEKAEVLRETGRHDRLVPHPEGFLVGCGRAHRYRGDLRRRARLPAARRRRTRRPRSRSMGTILATLFLGVSVLATRLHPYPSEDVTVFAQMGEQVFGGGPALWVLQILDRRNPDPGRQHGLRRLPPALVDHRA